MVHPDEVRMYEWYNYPHKDGEGTVRVFVVRISWQKDYKGQRWVQVRFECPQIGWGALVDISIFCQVASL
jgi:hypothetical protein